MPKGNIPLKITIAISILILLAVVWYFADSQLQRVGLEPPTSQEVDAIQEEVPVELPTPAEFLEKVNEERAKVGVAPLEIDERINKSAQRKADDMANNDYFDHVSPVDGHHGYEYIFDETQALCLRGGENLSVADMYYRSSDSTKTIKDRSLRNAIKGWVESVDHYDAMISSQYSLTGFGMIEASSDNSDFKVYVVQHFCELR